MARTARLVVPGYPHHVTQRGNRRQTTFFSVADYRRYVAEIASAKGDAGVDVLAWCLMPNHVHLVVVPQRLNSLSSLFSIAHRRYTRYINLREDWRGHLWQERFNSCVLDQYHLLATVRYVELNPVTARICQRPEDWPWSSAQVHLNGGEDSLTIGSSMLEQVTDWRKFLASSTPESTIDRLRKHSRTGRPLGDSHFIEGLEQRFRRSLSPGRRGRKKVKK
jgi:putative transposase